LVWPARHGQRGIADTTASLSIDTVPLVFETYKADWEIFNAQSPQLSPFATMDSPPTIQCTTRLSVGDLYLGPLGFSEFGDTFNLTSNLEQAGQQVGQVGGPLVAQSDTYVRYTTGFNELEYDTIKSNALYLSANQSPSKTDPNIASIPFPNGSIDVKASWIEMSSIPSSKWGRFHTRSALVFDPRTRTCVRETIGLVGLHIVQKTKSRPQWIWTTFEQVDNLSPSHGTAGTFNNGNGTPMPQANPITTLSFPPSTLFNVDRVLPINAATQTTNATFQKALAAKNSRWQFYQLVMTQWPLPPPGSSPGANVPPDQEGTIKHTFPGVNPKSAQANVTMETFQQDNGCMNCHNSVKTNTDFVWTLHFNAITTVLPTNPFSAARSLAATANTRTRSMKRFADPAMRKLIKLLQPPTGSGMPQSTHSP